MSKHGGQGPGTKSLRAGVLAVLLLAAGGECESQKAHADEPARVSALAKEPDWHQLEMFQGQMARAEFFQLLDTVYAPGGAWKGTITQVEEGASILTTGTNRMLLVLPKGFKDLPRRPPLYWKPLLPPMPAAGRPLAGIKIALDPGHLGGDWARLEERWFQIGEGTQPVTEGDMTLRTAALLAAQLRAQGAMVTLVRDKAEPVTARRPADLRDAALAELHRQKLRIIRDGYDGPADPLRMNSIQWMSELLFYRTAEIQERARLVNEVIKPDLVLCLHYNAEAWGDPRKPVLVEKNHLHLLVNGCYSAGELALDDVRCEMLVKLLSGCYAQERPLAESIANTLAAATGLPPYQYPTDNAIRTGPNPCVWARNLLANRLYECPVVYIEPYVMNSAEVWARVQAGDYEGRRLVAGKMRESIYREYADGVAAGVLEALTLPAKAAPSSAPTP